MADVKQFKIGDLILNCKDSAVRANIATLETNLNGKIDTLKKVGNIAISKAQLPDSVVTEISFNWSSFLFIAFSVGFYGNVANGLTIPTGVFANTSSGNRVILSDYGGSGRYEVYKKDANTIYVKVQSLGDNATLNIYGILGQ